MFDRMANRELNEQKAREYGKTIVNFLASGNYKGIISAVDEIDESWDIETFEDDLGSFIEQYKSDNNLKIEPYGTPCENITYQDGSEYQQENFYYDDDDDDDEVFDFSYEYDLKETDLTLSLDFIYEDGKYTVIFTDVHQL